MVARRENKPRNFAFKFDRIDEREDNACDKQ